MTREIEKKNEHKKSKKKEKEIQNIRTWEKNINFTLKDFGKNVLFKCPNQDFFFCFFFSYFILIRANINASFTCFTSKLLILFHIFLLHFVFVLFFIQLFFFLFLYFSLFHNFLNFILTYCRKNIFRFASAFLSY